jgi:hypothetical protein
VSVRGAITDKAHCQNRKNARNRVCNPADTLGLIGYVIILIVDSFRTMGIISGTMFKTAAILNFFYNLTMNARALAI